METGNTEWVSCTGCWGCNISMIRICEIDNVHKMFINIGIRKNEIGSGTKLLFTFLSLKFFDMRRERERHNLSMLTALYIVSSQPNQRAAPVAHKVVWPRPALNVELSRSEAGTQLTLFLKYQPTLPVRDVTPIPWSQFLSGIFILTSLNVTSSPRRAWTPALMLHLTNPCAKRKVLILTKPKVKIYKTKSLCNYITRLLEFGECWVPLHYHYSQVHSGPEWYYSYLPTPLLG